jgi:hypothetical protein
VGPSGTDSIGCVEKTRHCPVVQNSGTDANVALFFFFLGKAAAVNLQAYPAAGRAALH